MSLGAFPAFLDIEPQFFTLFHENVQKNTPAATGLAFILKADGLASGCYTVSYA
jgi:hypothetical protein